jgi:hypothetical protein
LRASILSENNAAIGAVRVIARTALRTNGEHYVN